MTIAWYKNFPIISLLMLPHLQFRSILKLIEILEKFYPSCTILSIKWIDTFFLCMLLTKTS